MQLFVSLGLSAQVECFCKFQVPKDSALSDSTIIADIECTIIYTSFQILLLDAIGVCG